MKEILGESDEDETNYMIFNHKSEIHFITAYQFICIMLERYCIRYCIRECWGSDSTYLQVFYLFSILLSRDAEISGPLMTKRNLEIFFLWDVFFLIQQNLFAFSLSASCWKADVERDSGYIFNDVIIKLRKGKENIQSTCSPTQFTLPILCNKVSSFPVKNCSD